MVEKARPALLETVEASGPAESTRLNAGTPSRESKDAQEITHAILADIEATTTNTRRARWPQLNHAMTNARSKFVDR
jgi:hypothetical protein